MSARKRRRSEPRAALSRLAEVAMVQTADHRLSDDAAAFRRLDLSGPRRIVVERLMRASRVVVGEVFRQDVLEMVSLNTITWLRHSRRIVPISRST